ncbi:unnamed protein product [Arabidopsis lyrata]|uniref:At2g35280-like TPR domain-containing protein n=1 Tax=Arabidopsis lyrata subsp. lyrata TaxID=81972 RepID=D7MT09_ARALL|nr:hypothetical protein ARALYDRAFT_918447 [Arabidopsis lyrata subsp. lyrata]CAH8279522.1 unnamed protein product [Arabidopsis lyrata]
MTGKQRASKLRQHQAKPLGTENSTPLDALPRDVISKIIGIVGQTSRADISNCLLTCKEIGKSVDDVQVFKRLELQMLQRQPLLAVGNYTDLMMKCLIHANPTAHYVQGVLEYFYYDNTIAGLHFLEKAANAPSPINEAIYLTGMINLCSGEFEIGKKYIDHLLRNTNESVVEECWEKIKTALHGIGILRKQEYINSLWAMMPPYMCNINDMQNTCEKCFHYKLMVKFVFMM